MAARRHTALLDRSAVALRPAIWRASTDHRARLNVLGESGLGGDGVLQELGVEVAGVTAGGSLAAEHERVRQEGRLRQEADRDPGPGVRSDVRYDGETRQIEDMVRLARFCDLDGNTLVLSQQLR
jgi:hypothetical protein